MLSKKVLYAFTAVGLIIPIAVLIDTGVLGNVIFNNDILLLALWPSSFLLSGFHGMNISVIVGIVIAIAINVALYAVVGLLLTELPRGLRVLRR
jgi:hypothetical protein